MIVVGIVRLSSLKLAHGSWETSSTDRQREDALSALGYAAGEVNGLLRALTMVPGPRSWGLAGAMLVDARPQLQGRSALSPAEKCLYRLCSDLGVGRGSGVIVDRIRFDPTISFRYNGRGGERRFSAASFRALIGQPHSQRIGGWLQQVGAAGYDDAIVSLRGLREPLVTMLLGQHSKLRGFGSIPSAEPEDGEEGEEDPAAAACGHHLHLLVGIACG